MKAKYVLTIFALFTMLAVSAQERKQFIRPGTDRERKMRLRDFIERLMQDTGCIPLGGTGCAASNANCCRSGGQYTGDERECAQTGTFTQPEYTCVDP